MHIQAPDEYTLDAPSIFLAGGTSDKDPWQFRMVSLLADSGLAVVNPLLHPYPASGSREEAEQIDWEARHFRKATAVLFWFTPQTLCPVSLFELGAVSARDIPLFVGFHPDYKVKGDIGLRLQLARKDVQVASDLEVLATQVLQWAKERLP